MNGKIGLVLAGLAVLAGCATPPAAQTISDPLQARAETAAAKVREAYDPAGPGAAYLISRNGRILASGAIGYANLEWDEAMTTETAIRIGSLSKPITAVMALQLVEENLLDLDQPVRIYAPDLPDQFGAVTMRQLLSHRSGLAEFLSDPALIEHIWLPITTDKIIELAKETPASNAPGAQYEYVNFNYVLVAHVIEKIIGRSYKDAVNSFFSEYGMANSHFDAHEAIIKSRAAAYELRDGDILNTPGLDMSHVSAAGALLSSATDLNRWIGLLNSGGLLDEDSLFAAWTPQTLPNGEPTAYGLGFNEREFCGVRAVWHTGLAPGGQAAFMLAPDDGLFTIVLSNAYNTPNTGKLSRKMMAAMLTGTTDAPCAGE